MKSHINTIVETNMQYIHEWIQDSYDYFIVTDGNCMSIVYMAPEKLWTFVVYNTFSDISLAMEESKKRNYQVIFNLDNFNNCKECTEVERFVMGKFIRFNYYAYI